MATLTMSRRWAVALASSLVLAGGLVAACSSNSNPQPAPVYQVGNDGGTEGGPDGTTPTGDGSPGTDAPSNGDGGLEDGQVLPDAPEDAVACTTDAGCWSCLPTTTLQFLNQCTASQCSPFVNSQRLPDYDG